MITKEIKKHGRVHENFFTNKGIQFAELYPDVVFEYDAEGQSLVTETGLYIVVITDFHDHDQDTRYVHFTMVDKESALALIKKYDEDGEVFFHEEEEKALYADF